MTMYIFSVLVILFLRGGPTSMISDITDRLEADPVHKHWYLTILSIFVCLYMLEGGVLGSKLKGFLSQHMQKVT